MPELRLKEAFGEVYIVNPKKLETVLRTNSAGIPYTVYITLKD